MSNYPEYNGDGYEVGWAYKGHPTPKEKFKAINELLDRHGRKPVDWVCTPHIRADHIGEVEIELGSGDYKSLSNCIWAVYGALREKPEYGWVPEGVRLPYYGSREYDFYNIEYKSKAVWVE